jgi:two-component system sensor histidine kinase KdpD
MTEDAPVRDPTPMLRRILSGGLSPRRQALGAAVAALGLPVLTVALVPLRDELAVESVLLLYLLVVVATAAIGGAWPAFVAVLVAIAIVNWWFTPPYHTLSIAKGEHALALAVFLVVAAVVALYVTVADRRATESAAARSEAAALDRANALRAALLRAVSHDLRTPLSSIKASVSSLRATDVRWTEEEASAFLAAIEDDTDRLNRLIGNLLDMSRVQAGAVDVVRRPVALDELVAAALDSLGSLGADVVVSVPEELPLAMVDAGLVERAVANVVANAIAWSPPGAPVQVVGRVAPPDVELCVVDHGPGLPPDARSRVYEPFQRLGDGAPGGVGLGLAIARGFVDVVGGELAFHETPGGGATFCFLLPAAVT